MGVTEPEDLSSFGQRLFVAWVAELRKDERFAASVSEGVLTVPLRESADWFTEHYGGYGKRVVTACIEELATYFDPAQWERREAARARVADVIRREQPTVLLAHSLGSVVAYETLCANPKLVVELFVTLGSPLAMRQVVFDRLSPMPAGRGARPPGIRQWVNIADRGDPVAVPRRKLGERFDGVDRDHETTISLIDPHTAKSYLRCAEVAREIAPYLTFPAMDP
jgi:pimeloyl-ACP methyl ester carboxylesterase